MLLFKTLATAMSLVFATVASPVSAQTTSNDLLVQNKGLLDKYISAKNAKDLTKTPEIYSQDYIENTGRNPSGLAAVTDNWRSQFQAIPDVKATLEDAVITNEKVVARITYSGTHSVPFFAGIPATGKTFKLGTIDIWRVSGGKFVEHWDQVDFAGLQRQLTAK
jgi:predicted ester cyclase